MVLLCVLYSLMWAVRETPSAALGEGDNEVHPQLGRRRRERGFLCLLAHPARPSRWELLPPSYRKSEEGTCAAGMNRGAVCTLRFLKTGTGMHTWQKSSVGTVRRGHLLTGPLALECGFEGGSAFSSVCGQVSLAENILEATTKQAGK